MNSGESKQRHVEEFYQHKALLFSIAYRMLGSTTDAEDMLQETFIRWQQTLLGEIRNPRAFLVTVISRLCIHDLESARNSREEYVGPWLPEPILTADDSDPLARYELHESVSIAFLLLLEKLTPVERAAFLLHDVFDYDYAELAHVLQKSETSCRQIVHRARLRVTEQRPRFEASAELHEKLLREFLTASSSGDMASLLSTLSHDVVLYADGGGKAHAASRPVHGADRVARFVLGAVRRTVPGDVDTRIERINGQPTPVYRLPSGSAGCVIGITLAEQRIGQIFVVTNPQKLERLGHPPPLRNYHSLC